MQRLVRQLYCKSIGQREIDKERERGTRETIVCIANPQKNKRIERGEQERARDRERHTEKREE